MSNNSLNTLIVIEVIVYYRRYRKLSFVIGTIVN